VFVCGQGLRSLTAAKLADRLGIGKVYSLDGGISNWTRAGLQLVPG
jgi:rhodanese-related sulfurtransferase